MLRKMCYYSHSMWRFLFFFVAEIKIREPLEAEFWQVICEALHVIFKAITWLDEDINEVDKSSVLEYCYFEGSWNPFWHHFHMHIT